MRKLTLRHRAYYAACAAAVLLAGCGTVSKLPSASDQAAVKKPSSQVASGPYLPPAGSGRGGYYKDDGPADVIPPGLENTPDAEPRIEPYSRAAMRPYTVFGKTYTPIADNRPWIQRGIGSWYGKKFHGQKTSSGEAYDMFKMTAAHPTLPIPSYARVTNLSNGRQVIVRVNDRGPFHSSRIIDLSYTAALKLGYLGKGSGELQVERLLPEEIERLAALRRVDQANSGIAPATSAFVPAAATASAPVPDNAPVALAPAAPAAVEMLAVSQPAISQQPYPVQASGPAVVKTSAVYEGNDAAPSVGSTVMAAAPAALTTPLANAYYLQLGAFSQSANADSMRSKLSQDWGNKLPPIEVVQAGMHYRLFSGPFATRAQAAEAAQKMHDAGSTKPMIVQR